TPWAVVGGVSGPGAAGQGPGRAAPPLRELPGRRGGPGPARARPVHGGGDRGPAAAGRRTRLRGLRGGQRLGGRALPELLLDAARRGPRAAGGAPTPGRASVSPSPRPRLPAPSPPPPAPPAPPPPPRPPRT